MSLRRTFLLGAAALAGVAALVAIAAVLSGDLGETEGKIFATLAATFVAGSALTSGVALLARRASPLVGYAGIVLALFGYVIWAEQIWVEHESDGYWKVLGTALIWTLALLLISTNRLMLSSPRLIGTLYPATAAAATLAAAILTAVLLRDEETGWQFFAVLLILAVLGEVLAPILERYTESADSPGERPLGRLAGIEVVAVTGRPRTLRLGDEELVLRNDEGVVVRPVDRAVTATRGGDVAPPPRAPLD